MKGTARASVVTMVGGDAATRDGCAVELREAGVSLVLETQAAPLRAPELGTPEKFASDAGDAARVVLVVGGGSARRDGAGALLDMIAQSRRLGESDVIIACVPRDEAGALSAALASGADDVVVMPSAPGELAARVLAAMSTVVARTDAWDAERFATILIGASALVRDGVDLEETLSDWLEDVCVAAGMHRAALLLTTDDESGALIVGASDDAKLNRVPIDLDRYPEVRACLESRAEILVDAARGSALLGPWAELAATHGGAALAAFPLVDRGQAIGALLLRSKHEHPELAPRAIEFLRAAAGILALLLRVSGALAAVREQTRRTSVVRHESERRARSLERYRDFLDSAPEGMVIAEADGTVLYLNRAAEQLTGYRRDGLEGSIVTALIDETQRAALAERLRQAALGQAPAEGQSEWFDLDLKTVSGEMLVVSASTSSALAEVGAAIVSFRDVTVPRALEAELQTTKGFLERLIDSTVDGIVAADLRGRVILFNLGASRLTGFRPEEVVGQMPVWKLYPPGQAQSIMRALRGDGAGRRGRLEPSRMEIYGRDGTLIPVSLTASLVYENGREVATVGVVSDLREQLRIEERLVQAQEKLIISERQAVIAELAGTTAHELNQPLTSVMGYSELLKKRMAPGDPHYRAVDTILREAERMAEIVRKIGRITKYETKTYVGGTQIIDLEKST